MPEFAKRIISNYFSVVGAQAFSVPLSLLYLSLVTRIMGPANYGKFALVLASFQFFYTLFISWIRNATIRFGAEEFTTQNKINKTFSTQALSLFIAVCFASWIIYAFRANIGFFTGLDPAAYKYIIFYLVFFAAFDFVCQLLQASHNMQRYAASLIIRQSVILGLVILSFLFRFMMFPLRLLSIESVSYFTVLVFAVMPLWKGAYFTPLTLSKDLFFDVLRYSWPVMLLCAVGYFSLWADTLLIRYFLNFEAVGKYEAANRMMQYVSNLILPISIIAFPAAVSIKSSGRQDLIYKYAQRIIPQASFFWCLFIILFMSGTGIVFRVVFGAKYAGSELIFRVLLAGLSFQFLSVMYTAILQSYDYNRELLFIALVTVIINLSGDFLLIPKIGIIGAAFSKSISLVACGVLYMYRSISLLKIQGVAYRNSLFFLGLPILLLAIFLLTGNFGYMLFSVIACIFGAYFFGKLNKVFNPDDIAIIRQLEIPNFARSFLEKTYRGLS